jgi:hypothetical protein
MKVPVRTLWNVAGQSVDILRGGYCRRGGRLGDGERRTPETLGTSGLVIAIVSFGDS